MDSLHCERRKESVPVPGIIVRGYKGKSASIGVGNALFSVVFMRAGSRAGNGNLIRFPCRIRLTVSRKKSGLEEEINRMYIPHCFRGWLDRRREGRIGALVADVSTDAFRLEIGTVWRIVPDSLEQPVLLPEAGPAPSLLGNEDIIDC